MKYPSGSRYYEGKITTDGDDASYWIRLELKPYGSTLDIHQNHNITTDVQFHGMAAKSGISYNRQKTGKLASLWGLYAGHRGIKSTLMASLEVLLSLLPLDIYIMSEAIPVTSRFHNHEEWKESIFEVGQFDIDNKVWHYSVLEMLSYTMSLKYVLTRPFGDLKSRKD